MNDNGFKPYDNPKPDISVTIYSGDPPTTIYFSSGLIDKMDLQHKQPFKLAHNTLTKEIRLTFTDLVGSPTTSLAGAVSKTKGGNDYLKIRLVGFFQAIKLRLLTNLTVPVKIDGDSITFSYERKE